MQDPKKPTQAELDIALHQFGQRMRAAWDVKQADFEKNFAAFREGVEEDWQRQQLKVKEPKVEEPKIEAPKIEPPGKDSQELQEPER